MTVIEQHFLNSAISFFNRKSEPDWEKRRYEIAKDVLANSSEPNIDDAVNLAIAKADALIAKLKK